jgi:hypothetical protein
MKRTDYKKLAKEVFSHFTLKEYNRFRKINRRLSVEDWMLIASGIRIGRGVVAQASWEKLQKELPITDEEIKYYNNLK